MLTLGASRLGVYNAHSIEDYPAKARSLLVPDGHGNFIEFFMKGTSPVTVAVPHVNDTERWLEIFTDDANMLEYFYNGCEPRDITPGDYDMRHSLPGNRYYRSYLYRRSLQPDRDDMLEKAIVTYAKMLIDERLTGD